MVFQPLLNLAGSVLNLHLELARPVTDLQQPLVVGTIRMSTVGRRLFWCPAPDYLLLRVKALSNLNCLLFSEPSSAYISTSTVPLNWTS